MNWLTAYKEMIPEMSDQELERQEKSFWKDFPYYSERDLSIYEMILDELIKRSTVQLFSLN